MTPTNRSTFSDYCLRKLGSPVIRVNVAPEQISDRIDEALYKFYEKHNEATEEIHMFAAVEQADVDRGYMILPSDITAVTDLYRPSHQGSFSIEYSAFINDIYSNSLSTVAGGIAYYYITQQHISLIKNEFVPDRQYNFNFLTKKLNIAGGLRSAFNTDGYLAIRCLRKIHGDADGYDTPEDSEIYNIWQDTWLQDYATALIKKQWGFNMSKFQGVMLLGGVQLSGEQMMQQAEREIEALEKRLEMEFQAPPSFFMG